MTNQRNGAGGDTEDEWVDWEPKEPIASPPPSATLDWIETELQAAVIDVLALPGGLSSAVHRLELLDGRAVVLRRYVLDDWMAREPNIPHDEARILELLSRLDLPMVTPSLVLADPDGEVADAPAIVMSEVPGRPELAPVDPGPWADALAETMAYIHAIEVEAVADEVGEWRRWDRPVRPTPIWTEQPEQWEEARERVPDDLPVDNPSFLHRDFHPNNVHWSDTDVVAIVDWLGACVGEPAADLAHCRWNLAVLDGPERAVQFTWRYRELTGYEVDTTPYDLATILSAPVGPFPVFAWHALGRRDLTPEVVGERIDVWLAHILRS